MSHGRLTRRLVAVLVCVAAAGACGCRRSPLHRLVENHTAGSAGSPTSMRAGAVPSAIPNGTPPTPVAAPGPNPPAQTPVGPPMASLPMLRTEPVAMNAGATPGLSRALQRAEVQEKTSALGVERTRAEVPPSRPITAAAPPVRPGLPVASSQPPTRLRPSAAPLQEAESGRLPIPKISASVIPPPTGDIAAREKLVQFKVPPPSPAGSLGPRQIRDVVADRPGDLVHSPASDPLLGLLTKRQGSAGSPAPLDGSVIPARVEIGPAVKTSKAQPQPDQPGATPPQPEAKPAGQVVGPPHLVGPPDPAVVRAAALVPRPTAVRPATTAVEPPIGPEGAAIRPTAPAVEDRLPFAVGEPRLCRKIHGFGAFEPIEAGRLRSGRPVLVYCELSGLRYQRRERSYVSRLSSRVELYAGDGSRVWEHSLGEAEDECGAVAGTTTRASGWSCRIPWPRAITG
ncbi:MAG: hypothetical protein U0790_20375 [Isosphaeraceae bacterium]